MNDTLPSERESLRSALQALVKIANALPGASLNGELLAACSIAYAALSATASLESEEMAWMRNRPSSFTNPLKVEFWELLHEWRDAISEDRIEYIERRIDELLTLRAQRGPDAVRQPLTWQPVETAPSDTVVLLYSPERHFTNPERIESAIYRDSRAGWNHAWATHWMPLPPFPATEAGITGAQE